MEAEPEVTALRARPRRLLDARQIASEIFGDSQSPAWVKRYVALGRQLRLGYSTIRWYKNDVLAWIEAQRNA